MTEAAVEAAAAATTATSGTGSLNLAGGSCGERAAGRFRTFRPFSLTGERTPGRLLKIDVRNRNEEERSSGSFEHQRSRDHGKSDQRPGAALDPQRDLRLQASSSRQQPPQGRPER